MDAKWDKIVVAAIALSAIGSSLRAATGVEVKLRERVTPKSAVVRLGDVADVVAADRQLARQLAATPLMPAPAPETERYLRQREVADMLEASGIDLSQVHFAGAERVSVGAKSCVQQAAYEEAADDVHASATKRRQAAVNVRKTEEGIVTRLDENEVAALQEAVTRVIADYVKAKTASESTRRVECELTDRQAIQLAAATTAPICGGGSAPWSGRQKFELAFTTAAGPARITINADVAALPIPVVFVTRAVERGEIITAADVELRIIEESEKTTGSRIVVDAVEKAVGMQARQAIRPGEILIKEQLQPPIVVKRGELITVGSQAGGIRVRTSAKALQDGATGELIQVESVVGKQKFDARVVGLREAAVFAPARVRSPSKPKAERVQTARRPASVNGQ